MDSDVKKHLLAHGENQRPHKFVTMMNIAREFAKQSACLRNQFGAIIATSDFTKILAVGYNGPYKGGPNHCRSLVPGKCGCIHAEANCLIKYPFGSHEDTIMFVTGNPCYNCATMIINADIKLIVYDDNNEYITDRFEGLELLTHYKATNVQKLSEFTPQ